MSNRVKGVSFLDYVIKILIILLLSGMLYLLYTFISGKNSKFKSITLDDESKKEVVDLKKEQILSPSVTEGKKVEKKGKKDIEAKNVVSKDSKNKQKLYTQEEMQEIIEMMIDQINELDKETSVDNPDNDNNDTLGNTLENYQADSTKKYDDSVVEQKTIESIKNEDIKSLKEDNKSAKEVDHYNKVVIDKNNDNYNSKNIDNISKQIGSIVDDITQNRPNSNYTNIIKKEVVIREDAMRVIVVKRGDTLSKISLRAYGTVKGYQKIFEANRELIKNPNHIYVGQRLRVPTL